MSINPSDVAILNTAADYHCIINGISKSEATNVMENINLSEKSSTLENIKSFFSQIKLAREILN